MPPENEQPKAAPLPKDAPEGQKPAETLTPHEKKALARQQRLRQALRSNLRRRKDQAREKE